MYCFRCSTNILLPVRKKSFFWYLHLNLIQIITNKKEPIFSKLKIANNFIQKMCKGAQPEKDWTECIVIFNYLCKLFI